MEPAKTAIVKCRLLLLLLLGGVPRVELRRLRLHAGKHIHVLLRSTTKTLIASKRLLGCILGLLLRPSVECSRPLVLWLLLATHRILTREAVHTTLEVILLLLSRAVKELGLESTTTGSWVLRGTWLLHSKWISLLLVLLRVLHHALQLLLLLHALLGRVKIIHHIESIVFGRVGIRVR